MESLDTGVWKFLWVLRMFLYYISHFRNYGKNASNLGFHWTTSGSWAKKKFYYERSSKHVKFRWELWATWSTQKMVSKLGVQQFSMQKKNASWLITSTFWPQRQMKAYIGYIDFLFKRYQLLKSAIVLL